MKKFFKFYLPLLIFLGALGVFVLIYLAKNDMAVLKYMAGEIGLEGKGKIISTTVYAIVKEDGVEQNRIKVLENERQLYLVFEKTQNLDFNVLIVDKSRKDVFLPLIGNNCLDFLFSTYLIETECAQRGDYYSSLRKGMYNVKFTSTDSQINFQIPTEYKDGIVVKSEQVEIIFKGKQ